ncbi:hypothetical protein GGQ99_001293 [Aminobacter niigataensis]|uniref:Uncharacterized protein n=1 Tax=Aminobacter niigataensis TaxID=83265 RepID=A0ABR6KYH0_9HYPH|nr:hypothetical protein [Aminobacter niigataensis]MBB4649571.1 hypothetical protein [Aminobacter niigataensis]
MSDRIDEVFERRLAKVRPINEIVGIATTATAWVGLSAFSVTFIWFTTEFDHIAAFAVLRYPVTVVACLTSIFAAYGLFWPLLKACRDLWNQPGSSGYLFVWVGTWGLFFASMVWLLGIGITFAGLAASLMPAAPH